MRAFLEHGDLCIEFDTGKTVYFGESFVDILRCKNPKILAFFKLTLPPEKDGFTYFIRARPSDFTKRSFGIQLTLKQAQELAQAMKLLKV